MRRPRGVVIGFLWTLSFLPACGPVSQKSEAPAATSAPIPKPGEITRITIRQKIGEAPIVITGGRLNVYTQNGCTVVREGGLWGEPVINICGDHLVVFGEERK